MKKTLMPLASFSSGKRDQRTKRQGSWTRFSFLALLVLLMIATTEAGIPCNADAQCRRDVCISKNCASRPTTNGICEANKHCFNAATESCIKGKCLLRSNLEGTCDDSADCATSEAICQGAKCLMPFGKTCSANAQCVPPSVCINKLCASKSPTGGDCDDGADCAAERETCSLTKCAPFDPSLMVWDGNKAPLFNAIFSPSVAVNGNLFVFEAYEEGKDITVEAYDPVAKTWSSKTGPGVIAMSFSVVAVGTNVFLIGGSATGNYFSYFYVYDTVGNSWDKTWDQLPEPRIDLAVVAVDSTVFIFGGTTTSGTRLDSIRSMDVSAKGNGWNMLTGTTLPSPTSQLSATAIGNEVFITGGSTGSTLNTVLKYNTRDPTTSPSPSGLKTMIQARNSHITFFDPTSKRLYAVGGTSNYQDTVEYLDLTVDSTGSWVSANAPAYVPLTTSFSGSLIGSLFHFVVGRSLFVLDISVTSSVEWLPFTNSPLPSTAIFQMTGPSKITTITIGKKTAFYDINTDTWTAGVPSSDCPGTVVYAASAVVNGELYVMGGTNAKTVYALNAAGDTWVRKDDLPLNRVAGCAAADGTDIYFYSGTTTTGGAPQTTLYLMDTTKPKGSGQWTTVTPAGPTPTGVTGCAAVVVGQKLLIFGGGTGASGANPTGLIQSFNIPTKTWDPAFVAPVAITPRSWLSAVYLRGFVFIIGGTPNGISNVSPKAEVFDVTAKTVSAIKDMSTPRCTLGSVTDGVSVFSVGGFSAGGVYFPSLEKLRAP